MISTDDGWYSQYPKIAVNGSEIHVVWSDERHRDETLPWNTELYYVRSLDGGITWDDGLGNLGQERRLTNAPYESFDANIMVEGDVIHLVWCDARSYTNSDIYYKRSLDKGATWDDGLGNVGQDRRLTTNGTNHGPGTMAVSGSTIHVAWVDEVWPGPNYYIYYRNSTDNGVNWGAIQELVGPFPGTTYRPTLAVENNVVHMTWMDMRDDGSTREIYYKNSTDAGANWNADLRLTNSTGTNSWWPVIDAYDSEIHIAWWDDRDSNNEIYYKRYPDFPDTTPPVPSNETPPPGSFKDAPGTDISVHVTDPSSVNESAIQLWVNGTLVLHSSAPIPDGYNISWASGGFGPGTVTCRIVAEDIHGNELDYTWNFTVLAVHVIPLRAGWNLVSMPFEPADPYVPNVLASIDGKWDAVKHYDGLEKRWKTYRAGSSANTLEHLDHRMGFWLHTSEVCNLTVSGLEPASTEITLYAGWNLVGYPSMTEQTVANALWGTGADRVEVYQPETPYIQVAESTYMMKSGEGYWVRVAADTVWVVDW